MREQFIDKKFNEASLTVIKQANDILSEFFAQRYTMTLRQLYYQFVSRDLFTKDRRWRLVGNTKWVRDPKGTPNANPNYKWLGLILSDARLAGLVDWAMMEDRVRELDRSPRWGSPSEIVAAVAEQYREDLWKGQVYRPEIWIEKDALAGVIERVCRELRIDFFACRGYVSQSAQYAASKRFISYIDKGWTPIVFHFGDHDPSGLDMTRENRAKFQLLTGEAIEVRRLALNIDQVREYNPPPNPAKITDTRATAYMAEYGGESWELDALDPPVIEALIRDNVTPLINKKRWNLAKSRETKNRNVLESVSTRWSEVADFITQ